MRTQGLALIVILTLALGIGANAAIFTLVRGVLLKPLVNPRRGPADLHPQSAPGAATTIQRSPCPKFTICVPA